MTKSFISYPIRRRQFLHNLGAGGVLLLPLLRAISSEAAEAATAPTMRLVVLTLNAGWGAGMYDGDGISADDLKILQPFSGDATGKLLLPSFFAPLESYRDKMNCFNGFQGTWWGNAHDVSYDDILTCGVEPESSSFTHSKTRSIDDYFSEAWATGALRLGTFSRGNLCHVKLANGSVTPSPLVTNVQASYDALIQNLSQAGFKPPAEDPKAKTDKARKSLLLNFVKNDLQKLKSQVPSEAFDKLQVHLNALSQLQGGSGTTVVSDGDLCVPPESFTVPTSYGASDGYSDPMLDFETAHHFSVIRAGLQCGTHRVAVFSMDNGPYPDKWIWKNTAGVEKRGNIWPSDFHEEITHWNSKGIDESKEHRAAYEATLTMRLKQVADFVKSLDNVKYTDNSTLLDKTLIVLTADVADGSHMTNRKPMITIGGGNAIKTGRYVDLPVAIGTKWWTADKRKTLPINLQGIIGSGWGSAISLQTEGDFWAGVTRALGVGLNTFGLPARNWSKFDL